MDVILTLVLTSILMVGLSAVMTKWAQKTFFRLILITAVMEAVIMLVINWRHT